MEDKMQSLKIIIAAAIVMFMTNMLTACSSQGPSATGIQRIQDAQQYKKTVELSLKEIKETDNVRVQILLNNPEMKPITSVQAWLSYNPAVLEGAEIITENSDFELTAPYDNSFDQEAGIVMIGRSTAEAFTETEAVVAEAVFRRVGNGTAMIEAFDYKQDLEGHTSANMVVDEVPYNILLKPESPLITILDEK